MTNHNDEIHLKELWISIKSRRGNHRTETKVWVDPRIEQVLLDRGEITDVDSVKFYHTEDVE